MDLACERVNIGREAETALFSIFRETLTNITKHAGATRVMVALGCNDDYTQLTVTDNGKGVDAADRLKPASFGLRGMEERAVHLGGTVKVTSAEPRGTCVTVRVPRRKLISETRANV